MPGTAAQGVVAPRFCSSDRDVSIKVGLDYKVSDDVLTCLTFSQGCPGAASNGQAFNNPSELTSAKPEKLDSFEAGVESSLLDKRVELNAAAFYYRYRDQQFLDTYCAAPTDSGCTGTGFVTSNAPRSRILGGEAELPARPAPGLELRDSIGVLDSKYQELHLHFADRSGNKLIMAPDVSGSVSANGAPRASSRGTCTSRSMRTTTASSTTTG